MSARPGRRLLRRCVLAAAFVACASAQQDPALRNVTVHYEWRRADELAAEGLRVDWQRVSGSVRVGNVVPPPDGAPAAQPGESREGEGLQGELGVLEGQPARIPAGVDAPVAARTLTPYGMREETASGESGYDVTPHLLGDGRLRLDLALFDERRGPPVVGGPAAPRAAPAASVTVAPGAKVAVGGLARDSTASSRFSGFGRAPGREERMLVVWVEVEAPEGE